LNAGETKVVTIPISVPASGTSGSYYLGLWIDPRGNITEMVKEWKGEENNYGGYDASTNTYNLGDFLKLITIN